MIKSTIENMAEPIGFEIGPILLGYMLGEY